MKFFRKYDMNFLKTADTWGQYCYMSCASAMAWLWDFQPHHHSEGWEHKNENGREKKKKRKFSVYQIWGLQIPVPHG